MVVIVVVVVVVVVVVIVVVNNNIKMEEHFQHLINLHITTLERTLYALNDYIGAGSPTVVFQNKIAIDNHISGIGRSIHQLTRDISKAVKNNSNNISKSNRSNYIRDINYSLPVDTYLNNVNKATSNSSNPNNHKTRNSKLKNPMKYTKLDTIERWQILCLDEDNVDFVWNALMKFDYCYHRCNLHKAFITWKSNTITRIQNNDRNNIITTNDTIRTTPNISGIHKYDNKKSSKNISPSNVDIESFDYRKYLHQVDLKISRSHGLRNSRDDYDDINYMSNDNYISNYTNHEIKEDNNYHFYDNDDNEYEYTNSRRSSWDNDHERSFSPEVFDAGSGQQIFSLESDVMLTSIEDYINLNPIDYNDDKDVAPKTIDKLSFSNANSQNFANLQTLKHQLFKYNRNELLDPLDSINEAFEIS